MLIVLEAHDNSKLAAAQLPFLSQMTAMRFAPLLLVVVLRGWQGAFFDCLTRLALR